MPYPDPAPDPLDPEALARLRELDPGDVNGLLDRVVNAYESSLDRLLPDLAAARGPQGSLDAVRMVAHTLKSSSASLGAMKLSRHCAEVELLARNGQRERIEAEIDAMLDELGRARVALSALRKLQP